MIKSTKGDTKFVNVTRGLLQGEIAIHSWFRKLPQRKRSSRNTNRPFNKPDTSSICRWYDFPFGFIYRYDKTKIVVFQKGGSQKNSVFKFSFNGKTIEIVRSYKYLGVEFFKTGLFNQTSKLMISKSQIASGVTLSTINRKKIYPGLTVKNYLIL